MTCAPTITQPGAGILCWELVAGGIRPFPHLHPDLIPRHIYKGARPTFSDSIPFTYRGLAQACWAADPSVGTLS